MLNENEIRSSFDLFISTSCYKCDGKIKTLEDKINQIENDIEEYNRNKDAIENLEKLLKDKKSLEKKS